MSRWFKIWLLSSLLLGCSPEHRQTEAQWTGSPDFDRPSETTPPYPDQFLGGFGGGEEPVPTLDGQPLDHVFVFVHGNSKTAAVMYGYRDYFRARGYNDSALWGLSWCGEYSDSWREILTAENSTDLQVFLEAIAGYTGATEARVVAHSQGGLLVKDLLLNHQPRGIQVTRLTMIASPHGDKTSATDAGAAACLFSYNRSARFCKQEFGDSEQAVAFRDSRVIADPLVEKVQVIFSGGTSDERYYTENNLGQLADVRYSPRDNIASPDWTGEIVLSGHKHQDHTELKDQNISEVFSFLAD